MIKLENIQKSYAKKKVLIDLDFQIDQPGIYGIVGPNGAGKTTFYRCLTNLESCKGVINIHSDLKESMGYLETNPYFFDRMTGNEYLQLIANARKIDITDFERWNVFDLPLKEYASHYSTGMKKKLAFSSLLYQQNELIILDEPFNGVDIQSNMLIVDIIKKWKDLGKVVLISSHIFSTMKELCDTIFFLNEGKFEEPYFSNKFDNLELLMKSFIQTEKWEQLELK